MFNIGPLELIVIAIVGLVVLGPDRLPGMARDAARMIKTLRELAAGARTQLRDELGPEFADVDLRNLNPRTALQRAVFGDEFDLTKYDPRRFDARAASNNLLFGADEPADGAPGDAPAGGVSLDKPAASNGSANGSANGHANGRAPGHAVEQNGHAAAPAPRPRPRPGPGPVTPYDNDAT